ncbi:hypothetical protein SLE2022_224100 [Rubroshorea leprosula]
MEFWGIKIRLELAIERGFIRIILGPYVCCDTPNLHLHLIDSCRSLIRQFDEVQVTRILEKASKQQTPWLKLVLQWKIKIPCLFYFIPRFCSVTYSHDMAGFTV